MRDLYTSSFIIKFHPENIFRNIKMENKEIIPDTALQNIINLIIYG
jgi:hypothetical protein